MQTAPTDPQDPQDPKDRATPTGRRATGEPSPATDRLAMALFVIAPFVTALGASPASVHAQRAEVGGVEVQPAAAVQEQAEQAAPVDYDDPNPSPTLVTYVIPALGVQLVNGAYWLGSRYILDARWARIDFDSASNNLESGFEWDDNKFKTNQFGHPYQGSSYYSVARASGLGFWQSIPYTFFGALTWELLLEREAPAYNDLITTTLAGSILGELSYRLANLMRDDSSDGVERGARESLALGLNPIHGLARMGHGDTWTDGPPGLPPPFVMDFQLAVHNITADDDFHDLVHEPRLALYYGDVAVLEEDFDPFDYMTFEVGAIMVGDDTDTFRGARFAVAGLTNGTKFRLLHHSDNAVLGVMVEFDYFENELLDLSTSGVGPALLSSHSLGGGFKLHARAAVFAHFGGIEDPHSDLNLDAAGDSRFHYSFGAGGNAKLWLRISHRRHGEVFLRVRRYNYNLVAGSDGWIFAGLYGLGGQVNVYDGLHVGIEAWASDLEATYEAYRNEVQGVVGTTLFVGYRAW